MDNIIQASKKFDDLLSLLLEGEASETDIDVLVSLAKQHSELKYRLKSQLEMDNLMLQASQAEQELDSWVSHTLEHAQKPNTTNSLEENILKAIKSEAPKTLRQNKSSSFSAEKLPRATPWFISAASIAACLIVSLMLIFNSPTQPLDIKNEVQDLGVAIVTKYVSDSVNNVYEIGQSIAPGTLVLDDGFMELEFYQGAQLTVAAPAELEILSQTEVRLNKGKVMTDVPPVAIGFTVHTPNSKLIDLGTQIGVHVDSNGESEVHVFDGLVEAVGKTGQSQIVKKGGAINFPSRSSEWETGFAEQKTFSEFSNLASLSQSASERHHAQWLSMKDKYAEDAHLVAYYDFEKREQKPRLLNDISRKEKTYDGAIVGANWGTGPWLGKDALEFKRAGDRVKVDIEETFKDFTLAAWVKIDSLDRNFNALLLTDGYELGDIHWQLSKASTDHPGSIVMGISSLSGEAKNYYHHPFFSVSDSGTWYHLTTIVDQETERFRVYVNGELVTEDVFSTLSDYWQIGTASIGNWDSQELGNPIRNLNGSLAELMIFSRALSNEEVAEIALRK